MFKVLSSKFKVGKIHFSFLMVWGQPKYSDLTVFDLFYPNHPHHLRSIFSGGCGLLVDKLQLASILQLRTSLFLSNNSTS
jgi:hypothetical protein